MARIISLEQLRQHKWEKIAESSIVGDWGFLSHHSMYDNEYFKKFRNLN